MKKPYSYPFKSFATAHVTNTTNRIIHIYQNTTKGIGFFPRLFGSEWKVVDKRLGNFVVIFIWFDFYFIWYQKFWQEDIVWKLANCTNRQNFCY